MIDPEREQIVSLSDAATFVQRKFGGRKPSANTMARWCISGLRGRKLESMKRGGQRVTSTEAVVRFFQAAASSAAVVNVAAALHDARQQRIEQELIARGV